ncbi:MAG: amidohydrolase family protein [Anaerolineae bacterium]|nr:MAG: amidohydrolase family protein [Anaerolineae bacterium]
MREYILDAHGGNFILNGGLCLLGELGIHDSKGIPTIVGPILFSRVKFELKDMTPKNPGLLAQAGVKVAIQTDEMSAVKYLPINAALAVREGMPEEEALKAITINAAEIIGVANRVGSLEVGKDADIVVFSGHPFDYRTVADVVLVDGQVAYRREEEAA